MEEKILNELRYYPGNENIDRELLKILISDAMIEVKNYINFSEMVSLPEQCRPMVKTLVLIRVNKLGSEGISSTSQSGITENYIEDLPGDLRRQLRKMRRLPRARDEY